MMGVSIPHIRLWMHSEYDLQPAAEFKNKGMLASKNWTVSLVWLMVLAFLGLAQGYGRYLAR